MVGGIVLNDIFPIENVILSFYEVVGSKMKLKCVYKEGQFPSLKLRTDHTQKFLILICSFAHPLIYYEMAEFFSISNNELKCRQTFIFKYFRNLRYIYMFLVCGGLIKKNYLGVHLNFFVNFEIGCFLGF